MATYNYLNEDGLAKLCSIIKKAIEDKEITLDNAVTETSENGVKSSGIYAFVTKAISDIETIKAEIVDALPTTGQGNIIYLVAKAVTTEGNIYDEFMWINSKWERIGSTDIDLSGYVKTTDLHAMTDDEVKAVWDAATPTE